MNMLGPKSPRDPAPVKATIVETISVEAPKAVPAFFASFTAQ